MGQGLTTLGGAAGAAEGFETLMTRRLLEQRQAEAERATRAQEMQAQAQLDEQKRYREAAQAESERSHTENERNRRISLALLQRKDSFTPATAMDPMLKDYPELSGFFGYEPESSEESQTMGPDGKLLVNTKVRPAGYKFLGTETGRISEENAKTASEDRALQRQNQITLAELASQRSLRNVSEKLPDGTYRNGVINANGELIWSGTQPEPGGVRTKLGDLGSITRQIDDLMRQGQEIGWQGVGVIAGPLHSGIKYATGHGSDLQDDFRIGLDSLSADIAHEKYGSAFTTGEQAKLRSFAPSSRMSGPAVRNRLNVMRRVVQIRQQELQNGGTLDSVTPVDILLRTVGGGGGTGTGTTAPGPAPGPGRAGGAGPAGRAPAPVRVVSVTKGG